MNSNNIYKVYQLVEYFVNNYAFNNILVDNLSAPNEAWLFNKANKDINLIRVSNQTLDETFHDKQRIQNYLNVIGLNNQVPIKFVDIHISKEDVLNEEFTSVCLDTDFYSGKDITDVFYDIKNVIHDVDNVENELKNKIDSINNSINSRLRKSKAKIINKFNINVTFVVILLCVINYLGFLFLKSKGYSSTSCYIVLGADYKMFTLGIKDFYRLFTYAFVHSSFLHLFLNMYSLFLIGNYIERRFGSFKYSLLLATSIIIGGLTHGILTDNQIIVGMSGGVYGLFAIYVIDALNRGAYKDTTFVFVLLLNIGLNFTGGIAWQSHLGGAIGGILFYYMFKNGKLDYKMLTLLIIVLVTLSFKYITIDSITPVYMGTDLEVAHIFDDLGFKKISENICGRLLKYYR